uniref:BRCA-2_OB1 domain-containing protein n=1 Tax=Brugia pahangi TaxID=6280 RepID=A0A0N4TYR0_BRUPA
LKITSVENYVTILFSAQSCEEVATILTLSKTVESSKSSLNSFKMHKSVLPDAYITSSHLSGHNEYDKNASEKLLKLINCS